jgi:hypothetical protein
MNVLKIGLAVLAGFALGIVLFRTPEVKANPANHVFIVPLWMPNAKTPFPADLPGARIAGISCIPKPTDKTPDAAVCFVATTLN